jgi:hypothetical protein
MRSFLWPQEELKFGKFADLPARGSENPPKRNEGLMKKPFASRKGKPSWQFPEG